MRGHEPERDAAAYVSGVMRPRRARVFEEHMVGCEDCWREVRDGRTGRALAERARELAPADLREDLRAMIAATPEPQRRPRSLVPVAAIVVLIAASTVSLLSIRERQPAAITSAVQDFRSGRMVASETPRMGAPDLSLTAFDLTYTGHGTLAGQDVDAFLYKDRAGNALLIYMSDAPFPVAHGALRTDGDDAPWRATVDGVAMLCASEPHAMLALADDPSVLDDLADDLGMTV